MLSIIEIVAILLIHWIGDFILQTDAQAKGKSTSMNALLSHTIIYSGLWLLTGSLLRLFDIVDIKPGGLSIFFLVTLITHTITDYFTSRLNKKLLEKGTHGFFISVGFDQILHYIQLFLTYIFIRDFI